jgi:hypothetical protein
LNGFIRSRSNMARLLSSTFKYSLSIATMPKKSPRE